MRKNEYTEYERGYMDGVKDWLLYELSYDYENDKFIVSKNDNSDYESAYKEGYNEGYEEGFHVGRDLGTSSDSNEDFSDYYDDSNSQELY